MGIVVLIVVDVAVGHHVLVNQSPLDGRRLNPGRLPRFF